MDVRVALQDVGVAAPVADTVQRFPLRHHVHLLARLLPRRQQRVPHHLPFLAGGGIGRAHQQHLHRATMIVWMVTILLELEWRNERQFYW
jgi:hypothetical protein